VKTLQEARIKLRVTTGRPKAMGRLVGLEGWDDWGWDGMIRAHRPPASRAPPAVRSVDPPRGDDGLESTFIRRAVLRAAIPWSGQIAFPAEEAIPAEPISGATAIREKRWRKKEEEVRSSNLSPARNGSGC